jgi:predicted RNA-binding protein with PIN domain
MVLTYGRGVARVLVVDGANVVGSRPDGWWKDRSGAARRLHERLLTADLSYADVVLVLEGAAKSGVRAGRDGHVRIVHARASGDDEIVSQARAAHERGDLATVITADRMLQSRVSAVGATTMSPSWLLDQL